jgi:hypothetical protein
MAGKDIKIVNMNFRTRYAEFLEYLSNKAVLTAKDLFVAVFYLLLQGRIVEARKFHGQLQAKLAPDALQLHSILQLDYLTAYLALYTNSPETDLDSARQIVDKYKTYPIKQWREMFVQAANYLTEIDGIAPPRALETTIGPTFDFKIDNLEITINYRNVTQV